MEEVWYYAGADRSPIGPKSQSQLEQLRFSGTISPETLVWTKRLERWVPYSATTLAEPPPPIPPPLHAQPLSTPATQAPTRPRPTTKTPDATASSRRPSATIPSHSLAAENVAKGETLPRGTSDEVATPVASSEPPDQPVNDDGWQSTSPAPWRRYFARMLDTTLFGSIISAVLAVLVMSFGAGVYDKLYGTSGFFHNSLVSSILVCAMALPLEALAIGLTGTSIGKWIFGVRITDVSGHAIGFVRAAHREIGVFGIGLGAGIPIVSLFTLSTAYRQLKDNGVSTWDKGQPWVVTYRPAGLWQLVLSGAGIIIWLGLLVALYLPVAGR